MKVGPERFGSAERPGRQHDRVQAIRSENQRELLPANGVAHALRLDDMNRRVLTAIYAAGLDRDPVKPGGKIDFAANGAVAEEVAKQGIVLLKNSGALPLAKSVKSIAVIGGYADSGVVAGSGSSLVHSEKGPAVTRSLGGEGPFAAIMQQRYHRSAPLSAIRATVPSATITPRSRAAGSRSRA